MPRRHGIHLQAGLPERGRLAAQLPVRPDGHSHIGAMVEDTGHDEAVIVIRMLANDIDPAIAGPDTVRRGLVDAGECI